MRHRNPARALEVDVTERPPARTVAVSWQRVPGWVERYDARHVGTTWDVTPTLVTAESPDGSSVSFDVPVAPLAKATMAGLVEHLDSDWRIGMVLVRRGGFAVARIAGREVVESKVGRRHVQGRTKAGGWSQQRFARRRDNQAQAAFDAAGGYVQSLLVPYARSLDLLVTGGDRAAADAVLEMPELSALRSLPHSWIGGLPDPTRSVLGQAIDDVRSVHIRVVDTTPRPG
jgi:Actinobacteria/chloroflexi VLRF1 release factor